MGRISRIPRPWIRNQTAYVATLALSVIILLCIRKAHFVPETFLNDPRPAFLSTSVLSDAFLECMRDVGDNLPISPTGTLAAHHMDATGWTKWNENIRFEPFDISVPETPLILDVGGNTAAGDSRRLLEVFPKAEIHIYEPVPSFVKELEKAWADIPNVEIHSVGLGGADKTVRFSTDSLRGGGTFIMDSPLRNDSSDTRSSDTEFFMRIVDAAKEVETRLRSSPSQRIDVLHVNCEGCEYELLLRLVQTNMLRWVRVLQVSFHNYGSKGIGDLLPKYCLIREKLAQSHKKYTAVPFGWERWTIRA